MRHCISCQHCIADIKAMNICSVFIEKCAIKGHNILHPFWSGFRCKDYRKEADGNEM